MCCKVLNFCIYVCAKEFINIVTQTNMHDVYILQSDWSLLVLANIPGSLHCKQSSSYVGCIVLQLPVVCGK